MGLRSVLARLPEGVELVEGSAGVLAVRTPYREAVLAAGLGPGDRPRLEEADVVGRRPLRTLRSGPERLLVREFHHGGLLRALSGKRFADPERPFEEMILAQELAERGLPTPEVVAARAVRVGGLGWNLLLVTRRIEGAVDGAAAIARWREGPATNEGRLFVDSLGAFLGQFHRAGLFHVDLHPANLLVRVEDGSPHFWILDLDRSSLRPKLTDAERHAQLARFLRYLARREAPGSLVLSARTLARFLRAYRRALAAEGAAGLPKDASRGWREDWHALEAAAGKTPLRHRFGWALEDLAGGR